jgi:hypothetical protein
MNLVPEAGNQIRTASEANPTLQDIKALCFGDFHLGQQMKVTRLSGRDPTDVESANLSEKQPLARTAGCKNPAKALRSPCPKTPTT